MGSRSPAEIRPCGCTVSTSDRCTCGHIGVTHRDTGSCFANSACTCNRFTPATAEHDAEMHTPIPEAGGYTRRQMLDQLDRVADPENWKNPIRAEVPDSDTGFDPKCLTEAVVFFCGCLPEIWRDGRELTCVQAAGYYLSVGA